MAENSATSEATIVTGGKTKHRSRRWIWVASVVLVALVAIVALLALNVLGVRDKLWKLAGVSQTACTNDVAFVRSYNAAAKEQGLGSLGDFVSKVKDRDDYAQDITCQHMILVGDFYNNAAKKVQIADYDAYVGLQAKFQKPSIYLNDGVNMNAVLETLKQLKEDEQKSGGEPHGDM